MSDVTIQISTTRKIPSRLRCNCPVADFPKKRKIPAKTKQIAIASANASVACGCGCKLGSNQNSQSPAKARGMSITIARRKRYFDRSLAISTEIINKTSGEVALSENCCKSQSLYHQDIECSPPCRSSPFRDFQSRR